MCCLEVPQAFRGSSASFCERSLSTQEVQRHRSLPKQWLLGWRVCRTKLPPSKQILSYTLARKYYIHIFLFMELLSPQITFQLQKENSFSGVNVPKITLRVFVCDSENYMEKCFGDYFLENRISVTWNKVFGANFAIISGWSVQVCENFQGIAGRGWRNRHFTTILRHFAPFYDILRHSAPLYDNFRRFLHLI